MNTKRWIAASLAFLATVFVANLPSAMAQTRVAIVDVGLVFKNHPQFPAQLAALKKEADDFKNVSLQQQQALMQKAEALKQYEPGSPEFKQYESTLAQQSAALEVDQRDKMRNLMRQEAKLHFDTYEQVNRAVVSYCEPRGIQLVLRYNSQKMDPKNPSTVMQRVNASVVYHNQQNDITQSIVSMLEGAETANAGSNVNRR